MGTGRRMSAADAAWLGLDRPEHLMVVTAVLRLGARVELGTVRDLVSERLVAAFPRFRQRPVPSRLPFVPPTWHADPAFSVAAHVGSVDLDGASGPAGEQALMDYAGSLMATPLDLGRAPWTLTLVQHGGHSALVARLHHCLADGIALAGVLLSLVDRSPAAGAPSARTSPAGPVGRAEPATAGPGPARQVGQVLGTGMRTVSKVVLGRTESGSRLRGGASVGRRAAWTSPLDLQHTKDTAKRLGVSVNDVLLAAVAGGLRRWLLDHGETPADLRVMVPVDLRRGAHGFDQLGNRFGVVFVTLPVSAGSVSQRVSAVRAATTQAKASSVAPASYGLLSLVGLLPGWGQGVAASLLGRIATGIVTNVPGPRTRLTLAGAPLTSVVFWVPHVGPIGVGVSIFSYAGTVTLGVATNDSLDIDPSELVAALEQELAVLRAG